MFYILRTNNEIILFYLAYRQNKYVEDSDGHIFFKNDQYTNMHISVFGLGVFSMARRHALVSLRHALVSLRHAAPSPRHAALFFFFFFFFFF